MKTKAGKFETYYTLIERLVQLIRYCVENVVVKIGQE
jgi:hypothetical protein